MQSCSFSACEGVSHFLTQERHLSSRNDASRVCVSRYVWLEWGSKSDLGRNLGHLALAGMKSPVWLSEELVLATSFFPHSCCSSLWLKLSSKLLDKFLNHRSEDVINPVLVHCSLSGSPVHGIFQATNWVGCHFLLLGLFQTRGSNLYLPHWRQVLYHLSHQGSML